MVMKAVNNENRIRILAPAKVNLTLEVLGRLPNGYHELRTVMHAIDLYDEIFISKNDTGEINVSCSEPLPANNTAYRAARLFCDLAGCQGADIYIEKRIPSEAGLGGASADAAGVLVGMQALFGSIAQGRLFEIGKAVGADVPFCLLGGCALAEGIGEVLTELEPKELILLLVKGAKGISTGALFSAIDSAGFDPNTDEKRFRKSALGEGRLYNDLLIPAVLEAPEIEQYRKRLLEYGAADAMMTGSGSVVYGVFESEAVAIEAFERFSDCTFRQIVHTVPNGVVIVE